MAVAAVKIDGRFKNRLKVVFGRYTADVGVLEDKPYRLPLSKQVVRKKAAKANPENRFRILAAAYIKNRYKTFAGGLARKTGRKTKGTVGEVSKKLRANTGINFYTKPFKISNNKEIVRFTQNYVKLFLRGSVSKKRVENLLQAVVRNPILRGDYGRNSRATAKAKGFNRFMIDTAQLFQAIRARVKSNGRGGGDRV